MKTGTRIKYTVKNLDSAANHVPVGTVLLGTVIGHRKNNINVKWDNPEITEVEVEYGIPAELFQPA